VAKFLLPFQRTHLFYAENYFCQEKSLRSFLSSCAAHDFGKQKTAGKVFLAETKSSFPPPFQATF